MPLGEHPRLAGVHDVQLSESPESNEPFSCIAGTLDFSALQVQFSFDTDP
jgi:hypothetical protein